MKKLKILLLLLTSIFCVNSLCFAQETDDSDSFADMDLDDMFDNSNDVNEAVESNVPDNSFSESSFFKSLTFTGQFKAEFGVYGTYSYTDDFDAGGILLLENTLQLSARASKDLGIYGSVYTALSNKFTIELKTLYFDYLMLDSVYVTAGKKSVNWGYPRLFGDGSLYGDGLNSYGIPYAGPLYTNILNVSDNHVIFQACYPWSTGSFTGITFYDIRNIATKTSLDYLSYAASLEFTLAHTLCNVFGRMYGKGEVEQAEVEDHKIHPVIGLEMKRTILGMDWYTQAQIRVENYDEFNKEGLDYIISTTGFYKIWDSFDPNIGLVMEYQYVYDPVNKTESQNHSHKIAVETGLKRIGKNKNFKIGLDWGHNFSNNSGTFATAFYISDLFPHANWKNIVGLSYGATMETPKVMLGSVVSVSMGY